MMARARALTRKQEIYQKNEGMRKNKEMREVGELQAIIVIYLPCADCGVGQRAAKN